MLDAILRNCKEVAHRAEAVRIRYDRLPDYAELLLEEESPGLEMDPALHLLGQGDQTLAFFITLDAVNFGSGYFPVLLPDQRLSGYKKIAAALAKRFREAGPILPPTLAATSAEDAARFFDLDLGHPLARELSALFARAWRDLGDYVLRKFGGKFSELVAAAEHSAEKLTGLLAAMPLYRDMALYRGISVPFYKRAQITAADLYIAFDGKGPGTFDDIDSITLLADNLVPHVLRVDGILHYADDLASRIDEGVPLSPGAPEEVEIRACAVHAAELLVSELRRRGFPLNSLWLDNRLWHRGQRPEYRARLRHRTLTPYY